MDSQKRIFTDMAILVKDNPVKVSQAGRGSSHSEATATVKGIQKSQRASGSLMGRLDLHMQSQSPSERETQNCS